jgi:hypothetical protein
MSISSGADKIEFSENGPVVKTIRFKTTLEGFNQLTCSISFYPGLHYVKYSWLIDKKAVRRKESLHLVFPFQIDDPVDRIGVSDTCFIPGRGQIPGSNKDFYSVQRWLDVSGAIEGVTICSPQAALFEFGSMTDERPLNRGYKQWKKDNNPSSTCFLYALNNYWNTNFKADQQGLIPFDCYLHFHYAFDLEEAKHFGEEVHFPLIATWY